MYCGFLFVDVYINRIMDDWLCDSFEYVFLIWYFFVFIVCLIFISLLKIIVLYVLFMIVLFFGMFWLCCLIDFVVMKLYVYLYIFVFIDIGLCLYMIVFFKIVRDGCLGWMIFLLVKVFLIVFCNICDLENFFISSRVDIFWDLVVLNNFFSFFIILFREIEKKVLNSLGCNINFLEVYLSWFFIGVCFIIFDKFLLFVFFLKIFIKDFGIVNMIFLLFLREMNCFLILKLFIIFR